MKKLNREYLTKNGVGNGLDKARNLGVYFNIKK